MRAHHSWLLRAFWSHRKYLGPSVLLMVASIGFFLLMPSWASVFLREDLPSGRLGAIFPHISQGLAIFIIASLLNLARAYTASKFLHTLTAETRLRIFDHVLHISPRSISMMRSGDVISPVFNDIQMFEGSLSSIVSRLVPSAVMVACFSVAMLWYSPPLLLVIVLLLSPLILISSGFGNALYNASHATQEALAKLFHRFEEVLGGAREIKSFGQEGKLLNRFDHLNTENLQKHLYRDQLDALHPLAISVAVAFAAVALLFASVYMLERGWVTSSDLTSFFVCLVLAYAPLQEASFASSRLQQFRAALERLDRIFNIPRERDGSIGLAPGQLRGELTFENLSFAYPGGSFKLDQLDLHIPAGQTVALVGPSGAGKSTLLDFIPGFLVPQSGRMLIDGMDLAELRLADLRKEIGIVSQEPILFEATLEENLRFGSDGATDDELQSAAELANVDEFARRLPNGYRTRIQFRGGNLSVGQRQRIAIARVLLKRPRILLFDEPTSALDAVSEDLIRTALKRAAANRTTLIIAHRLSTVINAHRIVVLSQGRVVEDGTHAQLLESRGLYHAMYNAQIRSAETRFAQETATGAQGRDDQLRTRRYSKAL